MNIVEKHIKRVLREKYQLRVGYVSSGPHLGRYMVVRVIPANTPGLLINQTCDRDIARDLDIQFRCYHKSLLVGMTKDQHYWISKDYIGNENIYFASHSYCLAAMYNLYTGLERWHPPYESRTVHLEPAGTY